jgi:hypothetical protein
MTDMPEQTRSLRRRGGKAKPKWSTAAIRKAVTDWLNTGNMAAQFAAQQEEIRDLLRDTILPEQGEPDAAGHRFIMFEDDPIPDPSGKAQVVGIKRERRAPKTLNAERAEALLRRKGLWDECTEEVTETVISEDAILAANFEKRLTDKELDSIYDIKESFAFVPQRVR